jgi:DNA polymerase-3 subunit epsilon
MIAHNAAFDFSVWRACLDLYRQSYPELSYLCSVKMARHVWPHLMSHKLNVLAHHLGLTFAHHNAAEDAVVCAEATIAMASSLGVGHAREIPDRIGMKAGRLYAGGYAPCTLRLK